MWSQEGAGGDVGANDGGWRRGQLAQVRGRCLTAMGIGWAVRAGVSKEVRVIVH